MKIIRFIIPVLFLTAVINSAKAQEKKTITEVKFEANEIILNNEHAFNYIRKENKFVIQDRKGNNLIYGEITSSTDGGFSSWIRFLTIKDNIEQQFYNEKIVGRNDLIFALCENNVITKDFELDNEKLKEFIKKFNQLESPPDEVEEP
ncbi:hypothetical protein OGH69_07140 [Flavobacterium sp. MFBS3-15]|uniref:hypothetical protein n=1 Tax=Flavobacterium sp. MFBS3-15 TaxID=2989816 RepID=UPI002235B377|nr:hypothetical protein [Flavobacterium sp. MFBS3-15]MCW4468730.1 hypothetical protein [Flavobacterium sp. MFBS3-15]